MPGSQKSQRSNRFSNFCSKSLSPKSIRVNSTPMPSPGIVFRTIASARTLPLGTSNASLSFVPTGGGLGVEMNRPPIPRVWTREKSWRSQSAPCQLTFIPLGSEMRGYRRICRGCSAMCGKGDLLRQRTLGKYQSKPTSHERGIRQ